MKTKLITALRTAAKALEDGTFAYNWKTPQSCNCGIIASTLMHESQNKILSRLESFNLPKENGKRDFTWQNIVSHECPVTGLSDNAIIRSMQEAGMNQADIVQLENLSNPEVLKRVDVGTKKVSHKERIGEKSIFHKEPIERTFWQWLLRKPIQFRDVETIRPTYRYTESEVACDVKRDKKEHTILYMRAWADLLTEQGREDAVPATEDKTPARVSA